MQDVIWTWGNANQIASILSWLYFILNTDMIIYAVKIATAMGLAIISFKMFMGDRPPESAMAVSWRLGMFAFLAVTAYHTLLVVKQEPKYRVNILSANELVAPQWAKCRPVNGDNHCYAPLGIKFFMTMATTFEKGLLESMERAMMDANALSYSFSHMGLGFPFVAHADMRHYTGRGGYHYQNFMEYYNNCILYDLVDGRKGAEEISKAQDLPHVLRSDSVRLVNIRASNADKKGTLKMCKSVNVERELLGGGKCHQFATTLGNSQKGSPLAEASSDDICEAIGNYGRFAFNMSQDADEAVRQRVAINLMKEGVINSALASGLDPNAMAYGSAMAEREQVTKWVAMGVLGKEFIPITRGVMQAFVLGLFWITALFAIATTSIKPLLAVLSFQLVLMVWSAELAIINYLTIQNIGESMKSMFASELGMGNQLTFYTSSAIDEKNAKALAYLGFMGTASFMIAMTLVGGMAKAFGSLAGGASMIAGSRIVDSAITGRQSFGQTDVNAERAMARGLNGMDKYYSDGSTETTNRVGVATNTSVNELGQTLTQTSTSSGSSMNLETQAGSQATINQDGKVVNVSVGNGVEGRIGNQVQEAIQQGHEVATQESKQRAQDYANSQRSMQNTVSNIARSIDRAEGKEAGTTESQALKNAHQKAIEELHNEGRISAKEKKAFFEVGAEAGLGFDGKIFSAKGSIKGGFSGSISDRGTIEDSYKEKLAKNLTNEMGMAISNSTKLSSTNRQSLSAQLGESYEKAQQTSQSYKEAQSKAEQWKIAQSYAENQSGSMSRDIFQGHLQDTFEKKGIEGLAVELNRLENASYAQEIIHKRIGGYLQDRTGSKEKIEATEVNGKGISFPKPLNPDVVNQSMDNTHQESQSEVAKRWGEDKELMNALNNSNPKTKSYSADGNIYENGEKVGSWSPNQKKLDQQSNPLLQRETDK